MVLSAGARLGPYDIVGPLGVGGMGEVYRARDRKLNREVAIKVLPDIVASDPERLLRFEREAQVLASLNHPNISHVYGLEESDGLRALVMELVEGPTLYDRIANGPIPIADALPIARQMAEALEAAHEQGIVHRDLKPANVKVREDGMVKVLDFGLAKALDAPGQSMTGATDQTTLATAPATQMGIVLGTPAYMSPEQARGRAVDQRADVWAFGVVFYEMLTGQRTFPGEDVSTIIAEVLKDEPDWSALPAEVPAAIHRLLRRCLEKDPKKRLRSIGDAILDLTEPDTRNTPFSEIRPAQTVAAGAAGGAGRSPWMWASAGAGVMAVVLGGTWAGTARLAPTVAAPPVTRLSVVAPAGQTFFVEAADVVISPDGQMLAFVAADKKGAQTIWVRPMRALGAKPIAGTENGDVPFWSPDSKELGFFADGRLKKVALAGGNADVLCSATSARGASWGSGGVIVFAGDNAGPLMRVSANGGEPQPATSLDAAKHETAHRFPYFLPDGRHFLFSALPAKAGKFDIFVGAIDAIGAREPVVSAGSGAVYAEPGYLLFGRNNSVVAQRFNLKTMKVDGEPTALGDRFGYAATGYNGHPAVSVSSTGALAYLSDPFVETRLAWFDRSQKETGAIGVPPGHYGRILVSPDGKRAAVDRRTADGEADIWLIDLEHGSSSRFAFGSGAFAAPVWSPDSRQLAYGNDRDGPQDIYVKPADASGPERPLFRSSALFKLPESWTPDGKTIIFHQYNAQTGSDLWLAPTEGDPTPRPYLNSSFDETSGVASPDGHWVAYVSNESGTPQLFVQSFPTPGTKLPVSTGAVANNVLPRWSKDSKRLLFSGSDSTVYECDMITAPSVRLSAPRIVATLPKDTVTLDATPDLQKLLVALPQNAAPDTSITVVINWLEGIRKQ